MSTLREFTSESVSEGHPDKIADQLSDAVLDAILDQDPTARVACETYLKTGMVLVGGEISTHAWVDVEELTRQVILDIGYHHSDMGFDGHSCAVLNAIGKQSPDIAMGVDRNDHTLGAGDQGIMFGFACKETEQYLPAPLWYSHQLMKQQAAVRKSGALSWLRPDAKAQLVFWYNGFEPVGIKSVVLSTQHDPDIDHETLQEAVLEEIISPVLPKDWVSDTTRFLINPTGRFVIGGPLGDCGLTGRKVVVDTYGGAAPHGGGAFSGKDPSKVDRSAAYAARYLAKNIVAADLAERCTIQLSYAIGIPEPTSLYIDTQGTGKLPEVVLQERICELMDLTPQGIIDHFQLLRPIYRPTATFGHFSNDDYPWERLDLVDRLRQTNA